jgi:hypothetical protein
VEEYSHALDGSKLLAHDALSKPSNHETLCFTTKEDITLNFFRTKASSSDSNARMVFTATYITFSIKQEVLQVVPTLTTSFGFTKSHFQISPKPPEAMG